MGRELDAFLALFSRETRENVLCLRKLVLEVLHGAFERVDFKAKMITYGYSKKEGEWVLAFVPHLKHVNVGFSRGAQLFDPQGLLSGRGELARHLKIKSEAQTQDPALRQLLEQAAKQEQT
ncbi:MAG: DUF1801 domain-containing protein [Candidatus Bathyarchaeota archaeon]|nr:DUF1801 domain-containing protein [Candidatus Bathyarchaeota archaeon]